MAANFLKLDSIERLDALFKESHTRPVVFFKHSATCGISSGVKGLVADVEADLNLVVVQTDRDISNEIAARTSVRHQSPQAIVVRNGQAIYHASHYDITSEDIQRYISDKAD
jgi:bacillithiol system protein YtxJ